jgi:hypothetical protein
MSNRMGAWGSRMRIAEGLTVAVKIVWERWEKIDNSLISTFREFSKRGSSPWGYNGAGALK